jgi:hypothetical protein
MQNNKLLKRILAYSAKKIKANPPSPYSTLNPETSSDSPSRKSKGDTIKVKKRQCDTSTSLFNTARMVLD